MRRVSSWQSVMRSHTVAAPPSARWLRPVQAGPAELLGAQQRAGAWHERLRRLRRI